MGAVISDICYLVSGSCMSVTCGTSRLVLSGLWQSLNAWHFMPSIYQPVYVLLYTYYNKLLHNIYQLLLKNYPMLATQYKHPVFTQNCCTKSFPFNHFIYVHHLKCTNLSLCGCLRIYHEAFLLIYKRKCVYFDRTLFASFVFRVCVWTLLRTNQTLLMH